jgi:23S rRNA (uracil1939-C5)-methyltransferase
VKTGEKVTVACTDLDREGAGLGTVVVDEEPALRVHVAGALPDETVTATLTHLSPHRAEGWAGLDRVVEASPWRRQPVCPAFGACGGCVLQHLDYPAQLAFKTARVKAALAQHALLRAVPVADCVASPRSLGYRNKAKLVYGAAPGAGEPVLGAYAPRSHRVVNLAGCRVSEPALTAVGDSLRGLLLEAGVAPYDEQRLTGDLRHVILRANHRGAVLVTLVSAQRGWPAAERIAELLTEAHPEVVSVVQNVNPGRGNAIYGDQEVTLQGTGWLEDAIGPVRLRLSSRSFLQANREVAALAYQAIAEALALGPGDRVVDAYAGVGGIALTLAPRAGEVIGIEEHEGAVADAAASATLNRIENARFVAGDAAARLKEEIGRAHAVVLNPPRKGCSAQVLGAVVRLAPRAIAYLSCDPETLARDLAVLADAGYRTGSVTPFDMLPHTPHVEALAILQAIHPA